MARAFDGASKITLGLGALNFAFGPGTIAAVIRTPAAFVTGVVISVGASTAVGYSLALISTGLLNLATSASVAANVTVLSVSKWYFVAVTKATGTVAPRFHIYDYAADTWVHENSVTSLANSSVPITRAALGVNAGGTGSFFSGDMAVVGVWNVVGADSQIESQPFSLPPWFALAQPKGLLLLDQQAVAQAVPDLSGGGANQSAITGTAVSANSVPIWTPYGMEAVA